jgi:isoleucyl-tRNA synthetase
MSGQKKHFLADIEEKLLKTWSKEKTFDQSLANRKDGKLFNFYDGPPFANGLPHYGHLVQTTIKDSMTRYKTMKGYYVPRRIGWDTHGLPVEYAVEKEHNFSGKQDIEAYGIDKFNAECRDSVYKYKDIWERMFNRVGRWADYENTYSTLDEDYIESVWWGFKSIYDKGLVYKDFRSAPYCPRCATPLSNFELNQGYQDGIEDPSLFMKFKLKDENAFLLGWTTTPWSLPGNAAIAVNPTAMYVYVEVQNDERQQETLVLARDRLPALDTETYHIVKEVSGKELVGKQYEPLFALSNLDSYENKDSLYQIWPAEFVSTEDGSGVLHVAPAFGEDDLRLSKENNLPVLLTVDDSGKVKSDIGLPKEFAGKFFKAADSKIIAYLTHKGNVYSAETITHTYPFCWRCDTPLLYYATDSWMIKVTAIRDRLVENNQQINWTPEHIRDGRFGKWLEGARDWAVSRNRYWGAPLPIWMTEDGEVLVIGSLDELKKRAINPDKLGDLHRPYIDDIEIKTDSGKTARRIPEVFDCWFESGAMPYAQDHYPFENKEKWEEKYPADFIAEAIDQTRGWFYTLHVLSAALFDKPAFRDVICSGWVVAADGEKLSKRKKNYAPMDDIFDQFGVDTLRFFMASSPIVNGEDVRFSTDYLRDVQRKIFMTLNNVHSFYSMYAKVDNWSPTKPLKEPVSDNLLDQWMLSRLNQTITDATASMEEYRLDKATRPIVDLLDDISNWFVRRSRRRFWKGEDDADKHQAYQTLHYALLRSCQLLAPFAPFLPDHLWRQLVAGTDLPASVHLSDWPEAGKVNKKVLDDMKLVREMINLGLSGRAENQIKVRQPLLGPTVKTKQEIPSEMKRMLEEELNVKPAKYIVSVDESSGITMNYELTPELKTEGLSRELIRHIQNARKKAGFNVDDRIHLRIDSKDSALKKVLDDHGDVIREETLAIDLNETFKPEYSDQLSITKDISADIALARSKK